MVDTLAPKKIFTQRELDTKLTPIGEQVLRSRARPKLLDTTPVFGTESSLLDRQVKSDKNKAQAIMSPVEEQEQNVKSSQETLDIKQTGERVKEDTPQGLVMKPISYAAEGVKDKVVTNPILVGEEGTRPELIIPGKDGTITILDADITDGLMMPPTTPMQVPEIDTGNLVSEDPNVEDQYEDSFSKPLLKSKLANRDTATQSIYNYNEDIPSVGGIVDNNFDSMIFPKIENNKSLPKNTDMTDISGAIRDSYKHGYTAGYFSLSQGRNTAEFIGSDLQEKAIAALDIPDNASMLLARGIGRDTRSDRNQDIIMDAYMDINNNKVGISIADQARKNLKFTPNEKLSGANLIAAEKEFQKLYNKNFINTVEKYEGDYKTTYPGYESVPTNKELKDLLYGKGSGTIKNRITSFFKDDFRDDKIPEQIIRYNPKMIDKYKKDQQENFRETSRGNPDTFTEM